MHHKTFALKGQNILEPLSHFVKKYYRDSDDVYISEYTGGFLVAYEDYSFLNSNQMMVCLRLDSSEHEKGIIKIEVISGGGSSSLAMGDVFGSEKRRISEFAEELEKFCKGKNITLEERES